MLLVVLVYLGLLIGLLAVARLLKPLPRIGISSRRSVAYLLGLGILIAFAGTTFPATETSVAAPRTQLDHFMPVFQFNEIHSTRVMAPADKVYAAIKAVTPEEIAFFRVLTWIRRFGRAGPASVLNAPPGVPLLETVTRTSFLLLADEPSREIVVGGLAMTPPGFQLKKRPQPDDFKNIREPGFAITAMNFVIDDAGRDASMVTTETRVHATDIATQRRFAAYWRLIYPGSSLIRRMWLRAIQQQAQALAP